MKLQLDTSSKTIKVESDVNLRDLVNTLEKLLPRGEWKEFKLLTNVSISQWYNPIVIKEYKPYTPKNPWFNDKVYCKTGNTVELKSGTFNVEF